MEYHEFIKNVQRRTGIENRDAAVNATRATLETLGERLFQETTQLAAQLPGDLQNFLRMHEAKQKYDVDEFLQRVSEREGTDTQAAKQHAQAVVDVLWEAVSEGEMEDVMAVLPKEYRQLFGKERTLH